MQDNNVFACSAKQAKRLLKQPGVTALLAMAKTKTNEPLPSNDVVVGEGLNLSLVEKERARVFVQAHVGDCDEFVNSALYLRAKGAPNAKLDNVRNVLYVDCP